MENSPSSKIYLPRHCLVPIEARENKNLTDAIRIYLGEINILTSKYGYLFAHDSQLAEMKGVSIKTIEKWNRILEREGFIKRHTWKDHVVTDKGVEVRTRRKIYVFPENSKNVTDPAEKRGHCDPAEKRGIKEEPLKKEQQQQKGGAKKALVADDERSEQPPKEAKPSALVCLALKDLGATEGLKKKVVNGGYSDDQIIKACEAVKQLQPDNVAAALSTALKEGWEPNAKGPNKKGAEVRQYREPEAPSGNMKLFDALLDLKDSDIKGGGRLSGNEFAMTVISLKRGEFNLRVTDPELRANAIEAFGVDVFSGRDI